MRIFNSAPEYIPFLDLVTPHVELEQELTDVFRRALLTAGFIGGPMVEGFEQAFAAFCGASHSIAISSGTDALRFAIMACGIQPGDVVLTVPHTFIATTEAISQAGAIPEFVDIDEQTYNISIESLREYLEERCTRDKIGETHQPAERTAGNRGGASAPLRPNGRHGSDPGARRAIWPHSDRGCLPGARRGILFEETESLDESRICGPCGCVQFLSWEEPGSVWGSWGSDHERCRDCR